MSPLITVIFAASGFKSGIYFGFPNWLQRSLGDTRYPLIRPTRRMNKSNKVQRGSVGASCRTSSAPRSSPNEEEGSLHKRGDGTSEAGRDQILALISNFR